MASIPSLSTQVYFGGGDPSAEHLNSTLSSSAPLRSEGLMIQLGGSWTWTRTRVNKTFLYNLSFPPQSNYFDQYLWISIQRKGNIKLTSSLMSLSSSSPVWGTLALQVKVPAFFLVTSLMRSPSLSITYWSPADIVVRITVISSYQSYHISIGLYEELLSKHWSCSKDCRWVRFCKGFWLGLELVNL